MTQYLEFAQTTPPDALKGQTLAVRAVTEALNVRVRMPTDEGEFPNVSAGARVR